ncbi:MAG: lipoic acid synthetase [Bradymonadia bacterium]|jgi:lipoic acid synthetase
MGRDSLPVLPAHPQDDRFGRDRAALRLPAFLRRKTGTGPEVRAVRQLLRESSLNTVCEEARCPNLAECFAARTATFMIMGRDCTRACGFCSVGTARPAPLDPDEPRRVGEAAAKLGLAHVVITSVNRDDLPDGGAAHFHACIDAVHAVSPAADIEILTPDFLGDLAAVDASLHPALTVFNHNIETVPRLYRRVRPRARYYRSLDVLRHVADTVPQLTVKSGLMVGLGERRAEVEAMLIDLRDAGVHVVTIGQYLRPSLTHVPVVDWLEADAYTAYREFGEALGFRHVFAGPFVRSSYNAAEALRQANAS